MTNHRAVMTAITISASLAGLAWILSRPSSTKREIIKQSPDLEKHQDDGSKLPPILCYVGGKTKLIPNLLKRVPEHDTYVEPFVGGASFFFAKDLAKKNVLNDLDPDLINFYKKFRNSNNIGCSVNPNRNKFDSIKHKTNKSICDFLMLNKCSFGCKREFFTESKKCNNKISGLSRVRRNFNQIKQKLSKAIILNNDFEKIVKKYDSPKTFFYFDPPFYIEGKDGNIKTNSYKYDKFNPERLASVARKIKGKFLISFNPHPKVLKAFRGFKINRIPLKYSIGNQERKHKDVVELLIRNY